MTDKNSEPTIAAIARMIAEEDMMVDYPPVHAVRLTRAKPRACPICDGCGNPMLRLRLCAIRRNSGKVPTPTGRFVGHACPACQLAWSNPRWLWWHHGVGWVRYDRTDLRRWLRWRALRGLPT